MSSGSLVGLGHGEPCPTDYGMWILSQGYKGHGTNKKTDITGHPSATKVIGKNPNAYQPSMTKIQIRVLRMTQSVRLASRSTQEISLLPVALSLCGTSIAKACGPGHHSDPWNIHPFMGETFCYRQTLSLSWQDGELCPGPKSPPQSGLAINNIDIMSVI